MEKMKYSNKDIVKITGIKQSSVSYYIHNKIVTADVETANYRGESNYFSKRNLVEFLLIKHLSDFGLKLDQIKKIINKAKTWQKDKHDKYSDKPGELPYDPLDLDDWLFKNLELEIYLIIYNPSGNVDIDYSYPEKKSLLDSTNDKNKIEEIIKKHLFFNVNMFDYESALILNITKLTEKIVKL